MGNVFFCFVLMDENGVIQIDKKERKTNQQSTPEEAAAAATLSLVEPGGLPRLNPEPIVTMAAAPATWW